MRFILKTLQVALVESGRKPGVEGLDVIGAK
jgi:hypothetical protein